MLNVILGSPVARCAKHVGLFGQSESCDKSLHFPKLKKFGRMCLV